MKTTNKNESIKGHPTEDFLGFGKAELHPIIEEATGESLAGFDIIGESKVLGPYGLMAEKAVVEISYTTQSGSKGRAKIFGKKNYDPGSGHGPHYESLRKYSAPIARIHGKLTDSDGRKAVFLEYLDVVTSDWPCHDFFRDPDNFLPFLSLIAEFNGIEPSHEDLATLPHNNEAAERLNGPVLAELDSVWAHAEKGELGDELKTFCTGEKLRQLKALAKRTVVELLKIPTKMTMGDNAYPWHVGRRPGTGEMVAFDLHPQISPRFWDVAPFLGAPEGYLPRCRPLRELASTYLREHRTSGGDEVSTERFLQETRTLWVAVTLRDLFWWRDRALWGPGGPGYPDKRRPKESNSPEYQDKTRSLLYNDLHYLVDEASE